MLVISPCAFDDIYISRHRSPAYARVQQETVVLGQLIGVAHGLDERQVARRHLELGHTDREQPELTEHDDVHATDVLLARR